MPLIRTQSGQFYLLLQLGWFFALAGLLGFCFSNVSFFGIPALSTASLLLQPWWCISLLLAAVLFLVSMVLARGAEYTISPLIPCLFALLLVGSDVLRRRFAFYPDMNIGVYVVFLGAIVMCLHLLRWRYERVENGALRFFSWPLLLFFQCAIALLFFQEAAGRVIFSDDHPSFWYRIYLLLEHFPQIPFYSPAWEAGYSAREFFASGLLNVFFLGAPLWFAGLTMSTVADAWVYNLLIVYVFVGILPISSYLAARLLGASRTVSVVTALLALGPSMGQFEWLLKYGTLGFCCAIGFIPLSIGLIYRLVFDEQPPKWRFVFYLLLASFLSITWSLAVFVFLPVSLYALLRFRSTFAPGRGLKLATFIVLFLVVNLPWMKIFVEESKVFSFVSASALPGAAEDGASLDRVVGHSNRGEHQHVQNRGISSTAQVSMKEHVQRVVRIARELLVKVNPLILIFLIPGLLLLPTREMKVVFISTILFLLGLAFLGEELKPQLELRRMILPASYLSCFPVALALCATLSFAFGRLQRPRRAPRIAEAVFWSVSCVLLTGLLLASPLSVAAAFQNRSDEVYRFAPEYLEDVAKTIQREGGAGRTFFLGFILHEFGASNYQSQDGGHISILAALSGKPMYAHFYYHSRWETIDPIPRSYRDRGSEGIERFLDLVNATAVVSAHREWAKYCQNNPRYSEVAQFGRFRIFRRRGPREGYVRAGQAYVKTLADGIEVVPLSREVQLKFRYLPKLKVPPGSGVELYSYHAFDEDTGADTSAAVSFIGLRVSEDALQRPVRIGY